MDADLGTLASALYVRVADLLKSHPERVPWRPAVGFVAKLSDAEVVTLAVMAALLGYTSERRWLRFARVHLGALFSVFAAAAGIQQAATQTDCHHRLADHCAGRETSLWTDDVWIADSTPVECGRSRQTAKRSDLAGFAEYGYCASHSRYFWGLRLHLLCTLHGLPVGFALTGAKADERHTLLDILTADPDSVSPCCAPPAQAKPNAPAPDSSSRCGRSSNRSTTPSKANSTSNNTAGAPSPASSPESGSASSPSPPRSGTTARSPPRSNDH